MPCPETVLVTGGNGGIGSALVDCLLERFPGCEVHASFYRAAGARRHQRLHWHRLDVRDEAAIAQLAGEFRRVDWLVNAVGFLHGSIGGPEKTVRAVNADFLLENMRLNALPSLLLAKQFGTALRRGDAPLFATLSARVGSIDDNRLGGWYSYRSSKAALNMALKTLSIEWRHSHPRGCVVALHPGTNDTPLSRPYSGSVAAQDLFDPRYTAAAFVDLLSGLEPGDSGRFLNWRGEALPW